MPTETLPEEAEIVAAVKRGEIPRALRPDVRALWRQGSGHTLSAAGFVTLFVLLLLVAPWIAVGFKEDMAPIWILSSLVALVFCAVYVALVVAHLRRRSALLADVAAGRVLSADGEIVWKGAHYRPRFAGQRQWSAEYYHHDGAGPGPYRFYFMPRSGYVLLVEPLVGDDGGQALTVSLSQALGFQLDDLPFNRRGEMSARQRRRLWLGAAWRGLAGLAILAYLLYTLGVTLPASIAQAGPVGAAVEYVLVIAFLILVLGYLLVGALRAGRAAARGAVERWNGPIDYQSAGGLFDQAHLTIQGQALTVPSKVWNALVGGRSYTCFTAPYSHQVLAIEPE